MRAGDLCGDGMSGAKAELTLLLFVVAALSTAPRRSWSHRGVLDELASMSTIECRQFAQIR
jgi:hypothetical protein